MSAPYDSAGAELSVIIDGMIDGVVTPLAAGPLIAEQLQTVAPTQFLQYEKIIRVLGRVEGMLITDGPPTPDIGAIDSTCIDITNHRFYGPKTSDGWGEGVVFAGADVGSYIEELGFITPDQYGAVGNGIANDTAALQAALDTGLNVIRPPGKTYMHNATLTMNTSGQAFTGGGKLKTVGAIDSVLVTGGAIGVKLDLTFNSPGQTAGYTVKIDNAHRTQINSLLVEDGYGTLWVEGANVVDIGFLWASCRGPGIKWFGDADSRSDILNIKFAVVDPGAGHYGFDWDGNCHSLEIKYLGIVCGSTVGAGNSKGFIVRNTSGGPAPAIGRLTHVEVDYPTGPGIEIAAGSDFDLANSYSLGSNDSALKVGASINTGEVRVSGGKYRGATRYGIENLGGPILYSGNADLSSNGLGETSGNVWTVTPRLVLGNTASGHYLTTIGANPLWAWEADSYMAFDVAGNSRNTTIGGTLIEALNATGLSITGVGTFTGYSSAGGGYYVPSGQAIQFDQGVSGNYNVYKTGTSLALTTGGDFLLQSSGGHSVSLRPDGANDVLAQYRGTTAQSFRVYNTRTDASNYERLTIGYQTGAFEVSTEQAGTGGARNLRLSASGAAAVLFNTQGSDRWYVNRAGHFLSNSDNAYDIGASGANRPRDFFLGRNLAVSGTSSFSDTLTVARNQNALTQLSINNVTVGTASRASFVVNSDAASLTADVFSSGFSGSGDAVGSASRLLATGAGGLTLRANHASGTIRFYTGSTERLNIGTAGDVTISTAAGALGWSDVSLARDGAADILAQRRGANAQIFRVYNTYTDASNYEMVQTQWSANTAILQQVSAGTGSPRILSIGTAGSSAVRLRTAATDRWEVGTAGHLIAFADNTYDIGALTSNRPKDLHLAGDARLAGFCTVGGVLYLGTGTARATLFGAADGVLLLRNNALTGFSRLQFGGTTSSFCALKPNGPNLELRLADDSGVGNVFAAGGLQAATGNVRLTTDTGLISLGTSNDTVLQRDAADIFAQYRGTNPQTFRIYNTRTDGSNYERAVLGWSTNLLVFGYESAGTGAFRSVRLSGGNSGSSYIQINPTASARQIQTVIGGTIIDYYSAAGHRLWETDNTYDIGASGASRPRSIYVGTDITVGDQLRWTSSSRIGSPSDGLLLLRNAAGTDFNRLQFGGTTSSFPALRRSGSTLQVYLADDSNYAQLTAGPLVGSYLGLGYSGDAYFLRDAAGAIAQYNGANAQTFRVYNTRTDGSNYERLALGYSGGVLEIGHEVAGTGLARNMRIKTTGAAAILFSTAGVDRWNFNSSGHLLAVADNTYDIGASGSQRPRSLYVGTSIFAGSQINVQATGTPTLSAENTGGAAGSASLYLLGGTVGGKAYFGYRGAFSIGTTTGVGNAITARWTWDSGGHMLAAEDNTYDIGASGANRVRTGYFGTSVVSPQFTIDGAFYLKLDAGNPQFVLDANDYFAYNRTTDVFLMVIGGASRLNITTTMVEATVPVKLPRYTVAGLPSAASSTDMHALVTDALTPAWRATVAGGGAELTMVRSNGTNWIVVG